MSRFFRREISVYYIDPSSQTSLWRQIFELAALSVSQAETESASREAGSLHMNERWRRKKAAEQAEAQEPITGGFYALTKGICRSLAT